MAVEWVQAIGGFGVLVKNVSIVSVLLFFAWLIATNRLYTKGQVDRLLEAKGEVGELWKQIASERKDTIDAFAKVLEPVAQSNAAILTAVEKLQEQNEWERQQADRQPPYRGGRR